MFVRLTDFMLSVLNGKYRNFTSTHSMFPLQSYKDCPSDLAELNF